MFEIFFLSFWGLVGLLLRLVLKLGLFTIIWAHEMKSTTPSPFPQGPQLDMTNLSSKRKF